MWNRPIVRALAVLSVASLFGCTNGSHSDATSPANESADFMRSLGGAPAVFVLDQVEAQSAAPIVTFDHVCQGQHYQHRVFDTITVWPSGRAQRAFTLEDLTNGAVRSTSHMTFTGTWTAFTRTNYYYFSAGPSLVLTLQFTGDKVLPMEMMVRIRGTDALTSLQAVGGSCPGSPNDGREVEAAYSRR